MFRSVIFLSFFFLSFNLSAQTDSLTFIKDIDQFAQYTNEGKWEQMLDMTHPGLFQIVPRADLLDQLNQTFNAGMIVNTQFDGIAFITPEVGKGELLLRRVDYFNTMKMTLDDANWANRESMLGFMKNSPGFVSSEVAEADQSITIKSISTMIAVKTATDPWKYLQFQPQQRMMLEMIIPKDALALLFFE